MLNGQAQKFAEGVSVCALLLLVVGCTLRRGCSSFHADRLFIFKSAPGGSQSFDELLMKEQDLTINFHRVIIYCFGNNSLKSLNTHLYFPMFEGSHELRGEKDSICLFISHVLITYCVPATALDRDIPLPSGIPQSGVCVGVGGKTGK